MEKNRMISRLLASVVITAAWSGAALAQPADTQPADPASSAKAPSSVAADDEIIVTARKRDETLISVPVVVTAISGPQLAARGVTNLDGLARVTPQLLIGNQGGSVQGGNIAIRGVSGPDQNPFGDSAVSFNIDGVQIGKATVRRMSDYDIGQIEVLKGPQALFFGKNSPAGIISIRTADPTPQFEAKLSAGYEFNARQSRVEGYVSGPVSETLGFRIAGVYSDIKGDIKDVTPEDSIYTPTNGRNPTFEDFSVRGTLKWEPIDRFDARLKVSYGELKGDGPAAGTAFVSCPTGTRFTTFVGGTVTQCKASDGANSNAGYGPTLAPIGGRLNHFRADGNNFQKQKQLHSGLEMNYRPTEEITLTSVTGYYYVDLDQCQNYENDPSILLPSCNVLTNKEFSQELRFGTDTGGMIDLTGGLFYAKTRAGTGSITYLFGGNFDLIAPGFGGPNSPALVNNYFFRQRGTAYSAYLQASFKPVEQIELNVGGRYTKEKKRLTSVRTGGGLSDGNLGTTLLDETTEVPATILPQRNDSWDDFSPEVTISYRPNPQTTAFVSYKHGFLSGGFNSASVTFVPPPGQTLDLSYDPQTIKGFEAGLKLSLLDDALRANLSAYTYKITDQQVAVVFNATNSITNAGGARVKGVEFDANYRTPLDGLSINGAVAYNKGKYTQYPNAPCYGGQTAALGCVGGAPDGAGGTQDLGGTELIRAPKWNLSAGFDFDTPIGDTLKLGFNGNVTRVTSYLTDASSAPNGRQPAYTLVDASARIGGLDGEWELALIGRNLTDKYYFVASSLVPFAFNPTGGLLDRFATLSRGREILLRASFKFGG